MADPGKRCGRGRPRENQNQQNKLAKLIGAIQELLLYVKALMQRGRLDLPEGDLEDEIEDEEDVNPFHNGGHQRVRGGGQQLIQGGGLEGRLLHALELSRGGVKIQVDDFHGHMHAEYYLDWETSLEYYFEWKPITEKRMVLFVKLKLKGTALPLWKRVEE